MKDLIKVNQEHYSLKKQLSEYKVTTKENAINIINFLSAISYAEKHLKEQCYSKLDDCVECDVYESSIGNKVKRINKVTKNPIQDEKLESMKEEIKKLTVEMKAYEKTLEQTETHSRYYKTV